MSNAGSSDKGQEGGQEDLCVAAPYENGSLDRGIDKHPPNTETHISGPGGVHLVCAPTPHRVLWLMNYASSSVVTRYCCDQRESCKSKAAPSTTALKLPTTDLGSRPPAQDCSFGCC